MDPVTMTLMAANMGGGLMNALGQKKAKSIDPEWLKRHFGAQQVNDEMVRLFNHVLSGPVGQQLMTSAAQQGQQFQNDESRMAARAGFGPTGGADSGASIFSGAAAGGATNAMQRDVKANLANNAMSQAGQMVNDRMQLAAGSEQRRLDNDFSTPSKMQMLGGMLARGANAGLMASGGPPSLPVASLTGPAGGQYSSTPQPSPMLSNVQNSPLNMGVHKSNYFSRLSNAMRAPFSRLSRTGESS